MKEDYEISYRFFRMVSVKKIDIWYYDPQDHRSTHEKIYERVIKPTFRIMLKKDPGCRIDADKLLIYVIFYLEEKASVRMK